MGTPLAESTAGRKKSLQGENATSNQSFATAKEDWQLSFLGIGKLDGTLSTKVSGGVIDYSAELRYEESAYATTTIRCIDTKTN